MVTEPAMLVPVMFELVSVPPPLPTLETSVPVPNWLGKVSVKLPAVSADGPALLITKLNVWFWPIPTVVVPSSLVTRKFTTAATLNVALPTFEFAPTVVVREPTGIELVIVPVNVLVTTDVTVQEAPGGMTVPTGKVSVPNPALTDGTPATQLVAATELKLTRPAGYASVNTPDNVAEVCACVLVIVMVSSAVPPARMAPGVNDLLISGRDAVTVSVSVAEQTPPVVVHEGLVLVTLTGGVIVATLTTWV